METWDAISSRRNVCGYTPDAVPEERLTRIASERAVRPHREPGCASHPSLAT